MVTNRVGQMATRAGGQPHHPVDGMDNGDVALTPAAAIERGRARSEPEHAVPPGGPVLTPEPEPRAEPAIARDPGTHARARPMRRTRTRRPTVARLVAERLAAAGARFAFTVPGESFLPLLETLPAAGIRVVATRHEGGAAFMATAAAHLTGKPQIVLATRTVGAANAAIGIHTARPGLVAARRAHRWRAPGSGSRGLPGVRPGHRYRLARHVGGRAGASQRRRSRDGGGDAPPDRWPSGPMLLVLPEDVLESTAGPAHASAVSGSPGGPSPDRAAVRQILKWLAASRRGVIVAGGGVLRARASKRLVTLADALAVPIIASWRRPDVVPNDHPGYLGMTGYWSPAVVRRRLEQADVVLVLGARMSEIATSGTDVPPRDTLGSCRPGAPDGAPRPAGTHLAVTADVARFLDVAWSDLRGAVLDAENRPLERSPWSSTDRRGWTRRWWTQGSGPGRGSTPAGWWQRSSSSCRPTPSSPRMPATSGARIWPAVTGFQRPGTFLGPTSGAMGYGLPAAIAASLVHPDRPVVAVCGDGGFAMTMAELETSVREGARPVVVVMDNRGYGTIRMYQDRTGGRIPRPSWAPIDFAAVAQASGALGFRVTDDAAFEGALRDALAARKTAVIHCLLDPSWVSVDQHP